MIRETLARVGGPTEVHPDVAAAAARPMIGHRGPEVRALLADVIPLPGSVISLGDVFLAVGLGAFIEDQLKQPLRLFRHRVQGVPGSAAER